VFGLKTGTVQIKILRLQMEENQCAGVAPRESFAIVASFLTFASILLVGDPLLIDSVLPLLLGRTLVPGVYQFDMSLLEVKMPY
jgi:hypothetical protein